jgi:uncharacterized repeat protein (TIGR03847 family)
VNPSFELRPDRLTVGTVGQPGQRLFFLQARQGEEVVTLKMEKVQVAALAAWIAKTLEDLPAPGELPEDLEPEPFDEPAWAVGSLGGSYDIDTDRIVLVAAELVERDEDADDEDDEEAAQPGDPLDLSADATGSVARFWATREQMAALAIRGTALIASGRPACPLCGYPLDPSGHACPRTNGHRPPNL